MNFNFININGLDIPVVSLNTVVVGTGCAGYNAADSLFALGQKDIAIVTEGVNMGTSRNTGSDKQTYYKLSMESGASDSVRGMAETLFSGGAMHGDVALVEASLSAKSFYKLVEAGVPFPHNEYGEYVGYMTDHDSSKRATSAGPLTSRYMTQALEKKVKEKGIKIFDGFRVISILTDKKDDATHSVGLIAIDMHNLQSKHHGITVFNCTNIIYATGGPAGMYKASVYPESQTGAMGSAFSAGAIGVNLTESQYGIASIKFRWNLSGTYQQVIPRYVSTDASGNDEREFLDEHFSSTGAMLNAIFLKGYQWPFDSKKIDNEGSSLIDILVYNETQTKGRRVFLDFTRNPSAAEKNCKFDFELLSDESFSYLNKSHALYETPIKRLKKMNSPAVSLYKDNGIDLEKEHLEIAVCAQHNNGGIKGSIWWESNIRHFFSVGEASGTFGVTRPGGSALNSTQVGSYRAAQYISHNYSYNALGLNDLKSIAEKELLTALKRSNEVLSNLFKDSNVFSERDLIQKNMTDNGAAIRSVQRCDKGIEFCIKKLESVFNSTKIDDIRQYPEVFINYDILISQLVYLTAIKQYIKAGGKSRGSYLIEDDKGEHTVNIGNSLIYSIDSGEFNDTVFEVRYIKEKKECETNSEKVRAIPEKDNWFETVWNDYMQGKIVR